MYIYTWCTSVSTQFLFTVIHSLNNEDQSNPLSAATFQNDQPRPEQWNNGESFYWLLDLETLLNG